MHGQLQHAAVGGLQTVQMGEELLGDRRGRLARRSRVAQVAASGGHVGGQQAVGDRWWPLQGKPTVSEGMLCSPSRTRSARGRHAVAGAFRFPSAVAAADRIGSGLYTLHVVGAECTAECRRLATKDVAALHERCSTTLADMSRQQCWLIPRTVAGEQESPGSRARWRRVLIQSWVPSG